MHVKIATGNFTDKNIKLCYDYLIKLYKEEHNRDRHICEGVEEIAKRDSGERGD